VPTRLAPTLRELRGKGLSLRLIAAELVAKGIQTQRGGAWTAASVSNLINRLK
jgi:hypothetical protein